MASNPGSTSTSWMTHGDLWFEDGNVVLLAEERLSGSAGDLSRTVAFQVHAGVLSRASPVLAGMLKAQRNTPSDSSSDDTLTWDDCEDVLKLDDHPLDVAYLLHALYDGL